MLKDYDINVLYHPDKANIVLDALSCMTMGSVSHIEEGKKNIVKDVHRLAKLGVRLEDLRMVDSWSITTPSHDL